MDWVMWKETRETSIIIYVLCSRIPTSYLARHRLEEAQTYTKWLSTNDMMKEDGAECGMRPSERDYLLKSIFQIER